MIQTSGDSACHHAPDNLAGTRAVPAVSGDIIALRLFDIAYAIDLPRVEALWAQMPRKASSRARLSTTAKAVAFGVPPVSLDLDTRPVEVGGHVLQARVVVRLYDFGAVAIELRFPVENSPWPDFVALFNAVDRAVGPQAEAPVWLSVLDDVRGPVAGALDRPEGALLQEDYLIALVRAFDRPVPVADIEQHVDLVTLLSGESRALSAQSRQDLLRQRFSYYADDLAILTWDRAFILEPRGDTDILDVLEVANAQLLEMRFYDELLDAELPRMYTAVAAARRRFDVFASRRFAGLARHFYTLVAEVTELTERVDNALQVTEDVYLARIYAGALDLFRVRPVSEAVDRKLAIMRDTYAALYDEASSSRSELLEIGVLILIMVEIVLALIR